MAGRLKDEGERYSPAFFGNESLLSVGVRDPCDRAVGVLFGDVHGEGAPAAANVQHRLPVLQLGSLSVEREHGLLGLIERGAFLRKVGRAANREEYRV
jgi:hypothetical protein